jgi:hypothetical protein
MFNAQREFEPVPGGLLEAVEQLIPFCPDVKFPSIHFAEGCITTANGLQSAEIGFDWEGLGVYRAEVIVLILKIATHWNISGYPGACYFKGLGIDGLFMGVKT